MDIYIFLQISDQDYYTSMLWILSCANYMIEKKNMSLKIKPDQSF